MNLFALNHFDDFKVIFFSTKKLFVYKCKYKLQLNIFYYQQRNPCKNFIFINRILEIIKIQDHKII